MNKAFLAGTALLLAGLAPALAQTTPPPSASAPPPHPLAVTSPPGPAALAPGQPGARPPGLNIDAMAAMDESRLTTIKGDLKLTPDQLKKWPAIETAIRAYYKDRIDRLKKHFELAPMTDPMVMLNERIDMMASNAAALKKFAAAADPLYKMLDPVGKKRLMDLTTNGGPPPQGMRPPMPGQPPLPGAPKPPVAAAPAPVAPTAVPAPPAKP